jgi:glycosyltransferase involved in cell wall biosynthesis
MKICMLAPEFLPVWGGVGTYITELVRHLPSDFEVHVVTPTRSGFGKEKVSSLDYDFSHYFGDNVRVHFLGSASDTFVYNLKFQYNCMKYVPKLVKEEGIDIIHSHTAHMPDLLLQFRHLDVPVVTTIHTTIRGQREGTKSSGMGFSGLESSEKLTYLAYPFLSFAESTYFLGKRHYITVSNWMKNRITQLFPELKSSSIRVIPNSVDVERFSPAEDKADAGRKIVLFTGRLIAAKGIRFLVEAIPKVLRNHPDALFVFIGAGNCVPYRNRLRRMGVPSRNFLFLGYLREASELVSYYRVASVYVAPTMYENLPIRVLEAMACGVSVVASNVCAIPEVIEDEVNGLLVEPGSVEALSDAICRLLDDSDLRRILGYNARETVLKRFSWKVNISKVVKIYTQVLTEVELGVTWRGLLEEPLTPFSEQHL